MNYEFFKKLQSLPETKKRVILWMVIIIVSLGLFTLYIKNFQKRIKNFQIERLKEEFKGLPKIEIPEELKKIGEEIKEIPQPQ